MVLEAVGQGIAERQEPVFPTSGGFWRLRTPGGNTHQVEQRTVRWGCKHPNARRIQQDLGSRAGDRSVSDNGVTIRANGNLMAIMDYGGLRERLCTIRTALGAAGSSSGSLGADVADCRARLGLV